MAEEPLAASAQAALLSGLKSGALEQAVAQMSADQATAGLTEPMSSQEKAAAAKENALAMQAAAARLKAEAEELQRVAAEKRGQASASAAKALSAGSAAKASSPATAKGKQRRSPEQNPTDLKMVFDARSGTTSRTSWAPASSST